MDGDDDSRGHRLDDMAHQKTCQVVIVHHPRSSRWRRGVARSLLSLTCAEAVGWLNGEVVASSGVVVHSSVVGCHVANGNVAPASCVSTGERERCQGLTWIHVDSDDDLRRHCLDDVARLFTCQIVLIPSKRHSLMLSPPSVVVLCPLGW